MSSSQGKQQGFRHLPRARRCSRCRLQRGTGQTRPLLGFQQGKKTEGKQRGSGSRERSASKPGKDRMETRGTGRGLRRVIKKGLLVKVTLDRRAEGGECSTPSEHPAMWGGHFWCRPGEGVLLASGGQSTKVCAARRRTQNIPPHTLTHRFSSPQSHQKPCKKLPLPTSPRRRRTLRPASFHSSDVMNSLSGYSPLRPPPPSSLYAPHTRAPPLPHSRSPPGEAEGAHRSFTPAAGAPEPATEGPATCFHKQGPPSQGKTSPGKGSL